MRQLLFPTDFSTTADNAFVYALQLAQALKAEITLFHAFTYTTAQALLAPADVLEEVSAVRHDEALAHFERYEKIAREDAQIQIKLHHVVRPGFAADVILEVCESVQPDLVIMGTKGSSNLAHDVFGSVTTSVLKAAKFPVLAIPEEARFMGISRIAYATDFREKNLRDLYLLAQFARKLKSEVCAVHVETGSLPSESEIREMEDRYTLGMEFDTMALHIVSAPSVGKGLQTFIADRSIDVLALHPHRRAFFQELLHPSLTQEMALHTHTPVLALHT